MQDKNYKYMGILIFLAVMLYVISVIIMFSENKMYVVVTFALLIIDLILLIIHICNNKTEQTVFQSELRYIIRTFDSILAYMDSEIPFKNKEIIRLGGFEDLVNCQEELKKPIFYTYNDNTAIFLIADKKTILFTTLKQNEKFINPLEEKLMESMKNNDIEDSCSILYNIDKTTIIQTKDNKKYRVSPVRDKELSKTTSFSFTKTFKLPKMK